MAAPSASTTASAVRRGRERDPPHERAPARPSDHTHPRAGEAPCRNIEEDGQDIPTDDRAEQPHERPEGQPERPAAEVHLRLDLRPEAVRVEPRRSPVLELVADE